MSLRLNWDAKKVRGLFPLLLSALLMIPATRGAEPTDPLPAETTSDTLRLDYVPADAIFVLALRPPELLGAAHRKVVQDLVKIRGAEYAELTFAQRQAPPEDRSYLAFDAQVVRSIEPVDWKDLLTTKNLVQFAKHQHEGHTYFVASQLSNVAGHPADDRTLLVAPPWNLRQMMSRGKGDPSEFPWADAWRRVAHRPLAIFMEGVYGEEQLKSLVTTSLGPTFAEAATPLWEELRWVIVSINAGSPMEIEIAATYDSGPAGRRAFLAAAGLSKRAQEKIEEIRQQAEDAADGSTADRLKMAVLAQEFVENAHVSREGAEVYLRTTTGFELGAFLTEFHRFAIGSRRRAAATRSE